MRFFYLHGTNIRAIAMKEEQTPYPNGRKSRLVHTKKIRNVSSSSHLLFSPLPLVVETLPFAKTSNSAAGFFEDTALPMRTHRADLLESVLEKSINLEDFFSVQSCRISGEQETPSSDKSIIWRDMESSSSPSS